MNSQNIPVLLLLFNRPDITEILIRKLREIKPKYIYISQDGPRNEGEKNITDQVKEKFNLIDRDCQIKYFIREKNFGCYDAVVSGITWFFENVEFGMILEDDCIPNKSFFDLCFISDSLYKDNPCIGLISGSNYQVVTKNLDNEFLFSAHTPLLWGWATWRSKWQLFNQSFGLKNKLSQGFLKLKPGLSLLTQKSIIKYMLGNYWDSDWYTVCYFNNLLTIVPQKNHISNLGFVGIHNARPGKYHALKQFDILYTGDYRDVEFSINACYDNEILFFLKKMYIYSLIESILRKTFLYKYIKRLIIMLSRFIYKDKVGNK